MKLVQRQSIHIQRLIVGQQLDGAQVAGEGFLRIPAVLRLSGEQGGGLGSDGKGFLGVDL